MLEIKMYKCEHCGKVFHTNNRHVCKHNPELKNCYSCKHWLHQFVIDISSYGEFGMEYSCDSDEACKTNSEEADEAFLTMIHNKPKYTLNCSGWEPNTEIKEVPIC